LQKAWGCIYEGNNQDHPLLVANYRAKHKKHLYISMTKINNISDIYGIPKIWNAVPMINHDKSFILG
jgi:hypothetical protein